MEGGRSGFGTAMEGFTPVRRRLSTISTRQLPKDEKEWTAARCNRLLRALKSRVAILNKDLSRIQSTGQGREMTLEVKAGIVRKAAHDGDWTQARKKIKHTYSTRGGRGNDSHAASKSTRNKDVRGFKPGEISVPTPILNRARGEIISVAPSSCPVEMDGEGARPHKRAKAKDWQSNPQLSEKLRDIRKQTPANRYTIYEGIYNGLEALLRATIPEEKELRRGGPKSLLSICLDKVPRYIAQEEEIFATHMEETGCKSAINRRDVSTEIYDDLEAFGSNGRGWKHLRTIVRSHGIQVISDAVRAGSLDAEFVGILVTLCIHTRATTEAEILLSSLLSTTCFPGPKSVFTKIGDEPATWSLSMLWKFVETTGSSSFQYRELSALLSGGLLPLGWLGSKEFGPIWTKCIQAISHDSINTDALNFLDIALPLLARSAGLIDEDSGLMAKDSMTIEVTKQTFSSLLTTLLSIVILSQDSVRKAHAQDVESLGKTCGPFATLIKSCLMEWKLSPSSNVQGLLLTIANIFLDNLGRINSEANVDLADILFSQLKLLDRSATSEPSYHDVVSFVCSTSRCCGRGASSSGFGHLENLHQILEKLMSDQESKETIALREIIADSALAFAQEVPDPKHLEYAATMEGRLHRIETKSKVSLTPGNTIDSSRIGFRWEEGISEWVAATPLMDASKWQDSTAFCVADLSESETPFRPSFQRVIRRQAPFHLRARALQTAISIGASVSRAGPFTSSPLRESTLSEPDLDLDISSSDDDLVELKAFENGLASRSLIEHHSESSIDGSGDELASESLEEVQSDNFEDSGDELQPSSPQSKLSGGTVQSLRSSPRSEDSGSFLADESFTSVASVAMSHESSDRSSGRRYIARVPRLSRRVLQRSLQWQLFDESDDELSFISVSSEGNSILQDITNGVRPDTRQQRQTKVATKQRKAFAAFNASAVADSEDELGI